MLRTAWSTASRWTKWYYKNKILNTIQGILNKIAPGQEEEIWEEVRVLKLDGSLPKQPIDKETSNLIEAYQQAPSKVVKDAILSVLADKVTKQNLLDLLPDEGLTIYK